MKKTLPLLLFFLFALNLSWGQCLYSFTQNTGTYSNISGTILSSADWDDYSEYSFAFPFAFTFFNTTYPVNNTFYTYSGFGAFSDNPNSYELLFYLDIEAIDNTSNTGHISYSVTGVSPNRILKLEIKNAALFNDESETDYVNYQVWFYEGSNDIEYHFGPSSVSSESSCSITMLLDTYTYYSLSGNVNSVTAGCSGGNTSITGIPSDGTIYRFSHLVNNTSKAVALLENIRLFPNPGNGKLNISGIENTGVPVSLMIMNALGKTVQEYDITQALEISLELGTGIYTAVIRQDSRQFVEKLVIE